MSATRKARLTVVCLLLTVFASCSRQHDSQDFLPSSPDFQSALRIVLAALSAPADGASTVRIEAQISADADPDKRTVRFRTTLGSWVDPGTVDSEGNQVDNGQQVDREADSTGKAAAFLRSAKEAGIAVITVSVLDGDGNALATVSGEVTFAEVTEALELRADPEEAFADGKSEIALEAEISAGSPASWNSVVFRTNLGSFGGTVTPVLTTTVATDASRIARARLISKDLGTATVTAEIEEFPEAKVTLLLTFVAAQSPEISLSPPNLDFGQVTVNTTSDHSLTIGNDGEVPLTVTEWVPDPATAGFAVAIAPTLPATIAAGGSEEITVRFSPTTVGSKSAALRIKSNDALKPQLTVALTGVAVAAAGSIAVDKSSLGFGEVKITETADLPLTISNTGNLILSLTAFTFSNDRFSTFGSVPTAVPVGGSVPVTVRFSPDVAQDESGVLTISSSDPLKPDVVVSLTGKGIP